MIYLGFYNENGYIICVEQNGNMRQVYRAGNNPLDSAPSQSLPVDNRNALSLKTIQQYCEQTGRDMAEEDGGEWGGVEYDE